MRDSIRLLWRLIIEQLQGISIAQIELLFIYGALLILIPGYVLKRIKGKVTKRGIMTAYFMFVYVGIILLITIFRREPGSKVGQISTHLNFGHLGGSMYSLKQVAYCILNVMLFVPFGFLVRLLRWEDGVVKAIFMSFLISFIMSFSVELLQLITATGAFEVTDLVTNVSGGLIGALCASIYVLVADRRNKEHEKRIF